MSEGERLQQVLARAGAAPSRRKAEALIDAGRVTIDGAVAELGARVPPGAEVRLDGAEVQAADGPVVFLLHKPAGVVSTAHDPQGRPTVLGLVPRVPGLHTVGRLDMESEGLLLLTNDGELTLRLTHPRYGHHKRYRVWCRQGTLREPTLEKLRGGVDLDDGLAVADVAVAAPGGCVVEIHEGRNRQVRRMLQAVGQHVTRLLRTRQGDIDLGDLAAGAWREPTPAEWSALGYDRPDASGRRRPVPRAR